MTIVHLLARHWGWIVFWFIILASWAGRRVRSALRTRHERRLDLIRARRTPPAARQDPPSRSVAGCSHVKVVPVRLSDGTLVRWVCANPLCGTEFPPGAAVLADG